MTSLIEDSAGRRARTLLRGGGTLLVVGAVAALVAEAFHPSHEPPNNHVAVFAEYAASPNWIAVHLAQFGSIMILMVGLLALLEGMRTADGRTLLGRLAEAATVATVVVAAVLQGVDGVSLKHSVDAWAAAPAEMKAAAFHDAETVRWIEWAMAGYFRIVLGLGLVTLAVVVMRSRTLPRWTGALLLVSGSADRKSVV